MHTRVRTTKPIFPSSYNSRDCETTYLDMLSDDSYRYFYKIISADQFGRVTKEIAGNGLITSREYNRASGHLNHISTGYNSSNDVRDITYTYDALNSVTSKIDARQNINSTYSYDSLNRLVSANIETLNDPIQGSGDNDNLKSIRIMLYSVSMEVKSYCLNFNGVGYTLSLSPDPYFSIFELRKNR